MNRTTSTVRRNLLANSLGIFISRAITMFVSFLSVPIIVKKLGIEGYGAWETIVAIAAIGNIFQTVISGTLLWLISNAYGQKDFKSVEQYIRIAVCIALLLFIIITPPIWIFRADLVRLFNIPVQYTTVALWIMPTIVGLAIIGSFSQVMGAAIGGFQRAGATTLTLAVSSSINYAIIIICLILGAGFWSLLFGFMAQVVISNMSLYCIARRVIGKFNISPIFPSREISRKVAPYVGFMVLGVLSVTLRDQTDKIVLASAASPEWTGYYGIAVRLASLVTMMCTFFYAPTVAAAGSIHSEGNKQGIYRLYTDVISVISFLVGFVVIVLAGFHKWIILLWIGRPVPEASVILYWLLFGHTIAVILSGSGSSVCKGIGIVRVETISIITGLLLNVSATIEIVAPGTSGPVYCSNTDLSLLVHISGSTGAEASVMVSLSIASQGISRNT